MKKLNKQSNEIDLDDITQPLKIGYMEKFFLFSSGANISILKYCPEEANKYSSIGATIVLTAMLASVSGGYAISFVFNNLYVSIAFGLFWGVIIFNLDRYIVMSLRKHKSEKISTIIKELDPIKKKSMIYDKVSKSFNTFLMALPRLIIAVIIALTVSKPIELRLFRNTIEKEISENNKTDISTFENNFKEEIEKLNANITTINGAEKTAKENIYSQNPIYKDKINRRDGLKREIEESNKKIEDNKIIIKKNTYSETRTRNVKKINEEGNTYYIEEEYKVWLYNRKARKLIKNNEIISEKIINYNKEKKTLKSDIMIIETGFKTSIANLDTIYNNQRKPILEQIANKKNSYNLDLKDWKESVKMEKDILTRLTVLSNLSKNNGNTTTTYWVSLLITLLFISLETAPVVVKLLTKRGPYDDILDRVEYEYFITQQEVISKLNSRVNEMLSKAKKVSKLEGKIYVKNEKQKLDYELANNKTILDLLAKKQEELAKLSIEKWYKDELNKLKE